MKKEIKSCTHALISVVFTFSFLILNFNSYAAADNFAKQKAAKITIAPARKTLRVGEKFVYGVYWMGINVGEGMLEVKELTTINGREAYHIIAIARSNDFLSAFYKVEDVINSYIDKEGMYSLKFEKYQREGRYKSDEVVLFDQEAHKGHYESLLNKTKKTFDIPPKVHDIPSAFYYFRTMDVKPNSKVVLDVNSDEKNWKATMNVKGTRELEVLRKGVYKVFEVEPAAPFKGVISKRSKAWIYFTADEDRVPVLIKIRIPFGFVTGVLEKTE
ncbi:MAG: DUF3108 domain-containing protein [Candidatus Omnitrophica bacterium]|nr:DUF3108 domain-containing protein [Candidatus Omnitrophota bacterium]